MDEQKKPLVIFVFSFEGTASSTRYGGFAKRLQKAGGLKKLDVLTVALENLLFSINEKGEADVIDAVSGRSMSEATLVYLKSRWGLPEEASALANFLLYKGIPFMDTSALASVLSKVATALHLWGHGVAVPLTLYARRHSYLYDLLQQYADELGERFILKDAKGAKGKLNFLVSLEEVPALLRKHPDVQFVAQRFIPNDGDYRIGVYSSKPSFVIKRVGSGKSHLNNTSAGGEAEYIETKEVPLKLRNLAKKAAAAVDLQIAGVDVIVDSKTDKPYILEVNQGSQIVTGAFTDKNMLAFSKAIERAVRGRYTRVRKQPTKIIGRRVHAKLKAIGIKKVTAKVDTGAYSSTLHAENIHTRKNKKGETELVFDILPGDLLATVGGERTTIATTDFFDQKVRSSNGQLQHRYSIKTTIAIESRVFPVVLTLSDRSEMGYPLLIGRRVLRSRFMVNIELNEERKATWKY